MSTCFDISVEQQLLCTQHDVLVLELVPRQQFGGAVIELQRVASHQLLEVFWKTQGKVHQSINQSINQLQVINEAEIPTNSCFQMFHVVISVSYDLKMSKLVL